MQPRSVQAMQEHGNLRPGGRRSHDQIFLSLLQPGPQSQSSHGVQKGFRPGGCHRYGKSGRQLKVRAVQDQAEDNLKSVSVPPDSPVFSPFRGNYSSCRVFLSITVNCTRVPACLLYTSDAADDLLCVDLGGRRTIKKKNKTTIKITYDKNNTKRGAK